MVHVHPVSQITHLGLGTAEPLHGEETVSVDSFPSTVTYCRASLGCGRETPSKPLYSAAPAPYCIHNQCWASPTRSSIHGPPSACVHLLVPKGEWLCTRAYPRARRLSWQCRLGSNRDFTAPLLRASYMKQRCSNFLHRRLRGKAKEKRETSTRNERGNLVPRRPGGRWKKGQPHSY